MFESILNFFRDDPLILKGFWSVVFLLYEKKSGYRLDLPKKPDPEEIP